MFEEVFKLSLHLSYFLLLDNIVQRMHFKISVSVLAESVIYMNQPSVLQQEVSISPCPPKPDPRRSWTRSSSPAMASFSSLTQACFPEICSNWTKHLDTGGMLCVINSRGGKRTPAFASDLWLPVGRAGGGWVSGVHYQGRQGSKVGVNAWEATFMKGISSVWNRKRLKNMYWLTL